MTQVVMLYKVSTQKQMIQKDKKGRKLFCPNCENSFLAKGFYPYEYQGDGYSIRMDETPAFRCEKCGAVYYGEEVMGKINEIQKQIEKIS